MGSDKAQILLRGHRLIDILLSELPPKVTPIVVSPVDLKLACPQTCEDPPFQGPVAGIAAGLAYCETADFISVLAVDAPFSPRLIPQQVTVLHDVPTADACAVVANGFIHPVSILWRATALKQVFTMLDGHHDLPLKQLLTGVELVCLPGTGSEQDYDTPAELSQLIRRLEAQEVDTHRECDQWQDNGNNEFMRKINRQ